MVNGKSVKNLDWGSKVSELIQFLIMAKRNTYASGGNRVESSRRLSKDLVYKEGDYEYFDSYFGNSAFSGQEVVYFKGIPIWSMNYFGEILNENQSKDVIKILKESLLLVNKEMPYRGPKYHDKEEMKYYCKVNGDFCSFNGEEKIVYKNNTVYELCFHGGYIK